jgi:hypothetical protein
LSVVQGVEAQRLARSFESEVFAFGADPVKRRMTYAAAVEQVRDGHAAAVLLDMVDPQGLDAWWAESDFPDLIRHKNFGSAATSGVAIGPLQRLEGAALVLALIDYFAYAAKANPSLARTAFVKLIAGELGAEPVRLGDYAEFPLASRREFSLNPSDRYSVGPHCDAIHFGRDGAVWPVKDEYDQVSTVLTIDEAENCAGIVLWDLRPGSRRELDALQAEYGQHQSIARMEERPALTVRARAGQMTVLSTRLMHAVENCSSPRRTIGAFLIWRDGGWRMFH